VQERNSISAMRSSPAISLFTQQPQSSQRASSFVISSLLHAVVLGVVSFGFLYAPRVNTQAAAERFTVRQVELDRPDPDTLSSAAISSLYPGPRTDAHTAANGSAAAPPSSRRQIAQRTPSLQTLLQPAVPHDQLLMKEVLLPALLLWSADTARTKNITPPPQHERAAAEVRPSLDPPNREANLADLQVSSTNFASEVPMPQPSATSPVTVHGPEQAQRVPETTSVHSGQPASAAVMSISDLNIAHGTVVLPFANAAAPGNSSGALAAGPKGNSLQPGSGDSASKGAGKDAGSSHDNPAKSAAAGVAAAQNGASSGAGNANRASAAGQGGEQGNGHSSVRITLPRNGQFGVVVVGSTMEEQYPETSGIWSGRMAYSVYLHVGMAKNWILQYSLPRAADAAAAGYLTRVDAPWPYYIVRPDLAAGQVNADALMIHGFVNEAGRFEGLTVAFPPEFAQARLVLDDLEQWQFRPAAQNGKPAKVEVLLIVPEEME
jgi:hypothetical protein